MATTSNTYTGNGSNKLFSITFPYLDTSDIDVYLNGTLQTITTQYTFANATTVEFVAAPANGAVVLLDRSTDDTALQATFFPGSSIKANDLNFNFDQVLYLSQETANFAQNQSTAGLQTQITAANNTSNTALTTANAANATANGIAGTANTALTNANVAVVTANTATSTANAATVIANSALTTVSGLSGVNLNRIINGDMRIDQRNAGASVSSGVGVITYTADRWSVAATGAAVTVQRLGSAGDYYLSVTGAASVTQCNIRHRIEALNIADLASTTVRVSFVCSSTTLTSINVIALYANATDNFATQTQISTQSVSISSSGLTYSVSVSLPALAVNGVELAFALGAFTSGTFAITNVQLEPGAVATPFERRPIGTELALCQRYYSILDKVALARWAAGGTFGGGVTYFTYLQTMRTTPSVTRAVNAATYDNPSFDLTAYGGIVYFNAGTTIGDYADYLLRFAAEL
jgi:hypothetical protein